MWSIVGKVGAPKRQRLGFKEVWMSDVPMGREAGATALVVVRTSPFNAETPIAAMSEQVTPTEQMYVRSHFAVPQIGRDEWRLSIGGLVARPLSISLANLRAMPSRKVTATMECAGNGRVGLLPLPKGEPWGYGAVSTSEWEGVPLAHLLESAGIEAGAVEALFDGADSGPVEGVAGPVSFSRSLPLARALDPDTLVAYLLNGAPLPGEHGGPMRLVVPGWYGMASVKWLAKVTLLEREFSGYYQADRYIMESPEGEFRGPLQTIRVRSIITSPASGEVLRQGRHLVTGVAWSGDGEIAKVEVSSGGEEPWQEARLVGSAVPHAWRRWEYDWDEGRAGRHVLRARATDSAGNTQPDRAEWNRLGYCNNAVQPVVVEVAPQALHGG
jgi:DMSO/TMAO reductase YedYZ molybdopterin-dependent catalytic subunit